MEGARYSAGLRSLASRRPATDVALLHRLQPENYKYIFYNWWNKLPLSGRNHPRWRPARDRARSTGSDLKTLCGWIRVDSSAERHRFSASPRGREPHGYSRNRISQPHLPAASSYTRVNSHWALTRLRRLPSGLQKMSHASLRGSLYPRLV